MLPRLLNPGSPGFEPLYIVLFDGGPARRDHGPVVLQNAAAPLQLQDATSPHGLERGFIPILRLLWFVLHLPRTFFDTIEIETTRLEETSHLKFPHRVVIVPSYLTGDDRFKQTCRSYNPSAVFALPEHRQIAQRFSVEIEAQLGAIIDPPAEHLPQLWHRMSGLFVTSLPRMHEPTRILGFDDQSVPMIADMFLARQLDLEEWYLELPRRDRYDLVVASLELHAVRSAARAIDAERDADDRRLEQLLDEGRRRTSTCAVLGVAGVAPAHARRLPQAAVGDDDAEASALRFLVAHAAAETEGTGIVLDNLPANIFESYRRLEEHCRAGRGHSNAPYVWRCIREIGRGLAAFLGRETALLLRHARSAIAFSDFPIGLAILDGDTAPLACRLPIYYRPLTPLTRAVQRETDVDYYPYWGDGISVLIAECLDENDSNDREAELARESLRYWRNLKIILEETGVCEVVIAHVNTETELARALSERSYDVLLLSAHGQYRPEENSAKIVIGGVATLLLDVDNVPPVVVLSACHVNPRGAGAVTVADLLLRQGAKAVLGAVVPIGVSENACLMTRFFVYICEAIGGRSRQTLAEIWHHTASTNAVHDICFSSRRMQEWLRSVDGNGLSVNHEFKLFASVGRLRREHIYQDTEVVLNEIAIRRGFGDVFRSTLRSQGYFPESIFYTFVGRPDHIVVKDPIWEQARVARS